MGQRIDVAFICKIVSVFTLATLADCLSPNAKANYTNNINPLNFNSVFTSTEKPRISPVKKWQVGRVSRKHYEIVNMLWRKTKIFVDIESTTPTGPRLRRNHQKSSLPNNYDNFKPYLTILPNTGRPILHTSTASFIEFYYLDDSDERLKRRESFIPAFENSRRKQQFSDNNIFLQSPNLSFRVNDRVPKGLPKSSRTTVNSQLRKQPVDEKPSVYGYLSSRFKIGLLPKPNSKVDHNVSITDSTIPTVKLNSETCPATTLEPDNFETDTSDSRTTINENVHSKTISENMDIITTANDKIKFFEMYDRHTVKSRQDIDKIMLYSDESDMVKENYIDGNQKIHLEDVDQSVAHHDGNKVKNVKKHIDKSAISLVVQNVSEEKLEKKLKFKTVMFNINKTATDLRNESRKVPKISSRVALWSDYPFAAVYVYEPSQVHCDAAALSPHWLVAAGSCLSRFRHKDPLSEGRSAFVAYCGQSWWSPGRVSYVKYSIVHPRFHPKDDTRRFIYNIGLIQVVTSMASCSGWAPLSLMSHHFAADSDGSIGTAVGWGLDRYDVRYSSVSLPKLPLSAFNGFVYSESCPGSSTFGKGTFSNEESTLKNLYCLSLPAYSGEQNDPVHGSLLLVGGKLIALYLQEERRLWGEQSAQYTGVWRLVPWVHEVAREQYEADSFGIDF